MSFRSWNIIFFLFCAGLIGSSYNEINQISSPYELKTIRYSGNEILKPEPYSFNLDYNDSIVKLSRKSPYGLSKSIYDFQNEEYFHITVWRLGNNEDGKIVADGIGDSRFYYKQSRPSIIDTNGWQLLTLEIHIPPHHHIRELKIYVWNSGKNVIYFKDLNIERFPQKKYPEFAQPALKINLDSNDMMKLKAIRSEAFKNSILETGKNDYVKAQLIYGSDTMKARIRLKGDLLDHLIGSKWSFRIKMRKDDSWKNMRSFSIQSPETRGFLDEWFTHQVFASEDVLTPRYGFVPVFLNGRSLGIYAYEEHFDNHLIESNNRREGPILKFSEELFFTLIKLNYTEGKDYQVPFFNASDILPFKENRTLNDRILYDEFLIAQNLLYQFKNDLKPVSEIFDMKSLAKYYALSDVTSAYHGFKWHNIRFYYNPVLCRLEPVAYDCYPLSGIKYGSGFKTIIEDFQKLKSVSEFDNMLLLPLKNDDFRREYILNQTKYSREDFLDSIYDSHASELDSLAGLIKKEFGYFHFDLQPYKTRCEEIVRFLGKYKDSKSKRPPGLKVNKIITDTALSGDFFPFLIKIFRNRYNSDSVLYINNYYPGEIKFIAYSDTDTVLKYMTDTIDIPVKAVNFPLKTDLPDKTDYLFFILGNKIKLFSAPIFQWNIPYDFSPAQELSEKYQFNYLNVFKQTDSSLMVEGKLDISESLIIPAGYHVIFKPGTELNFMNNSTFISYSPVFIMGTAEEPVVIFSNDGTAMGFHVFRSGQKSKLEYVVFDQFNTLDYDGWMLTGAVNFYESDVEMKSVTFMNNRCEDALNIIRSNFEIADCTFDNIFADAFDSDFSTGTIENSLFRDIANDATDFSGSRVVMENCELYHSGDKAISCGERSEIWIENVKIDHSNIAVASKDLSRLTISNSLILNSDYSFIAFKKKPEYGAAEIHVKNTTIDHIIKGQVIEQGSVIYVNDKTVHGTAKGVAGMFYID